MATKWTDEQLSAINTRDKTLLVSAAAGSGKTATLTERIIRSLTDSENPMNIDSVLVVTFTKAAAGELRTKISRALTKAVEENPENQHLKRQLYLLPSAKIRTIDSFCNEILRANCDRVGISPGFRIADTAECELLAISIIEGLIEAVYNGELPEIASAAEFEELAECLTDSGKTEELAGVFRAIHLKLENAEDGVHLLGKMIENYNLKDTPIEETLYCAYLMDKLHTMLDYYIDCYERYIRDFSLGSDAEKKYLDMALGDLDTIRRIRYAGSYDRTREEIIGFALSKRPGVKKTDRMESFALVRDDMKDDLLKAKEWFNYTSSQWAELYKNLYRLTSVFYRFEVEFDRKFSEEKRRHNAFSYSDILRYTYNCLLENGEPTDIAENVASQFKAIYIDEYQDVNSLQNRVFEAISRPNNRFMVGDIKQSIYVFRSACPDIFASMKKAFPGLEESTGDCASIFMSSNFRCDKGIVDFVNNIFDKAFSFVADSIGYVDSDRLKAAKVYDAADGEPEYRYPQVCLVDKALGDEGQPDTVARKIKELLTDGKLNNGEPIRPSDIAIILRNAKGRDGKYARALEKYGIPSCISGDKDFFLCPEVLLALCLLNTIDNPRRDIYLAGLLKSPLFNFTVDELYRIRLAGDESLYEALVSYTNANPEFTKGLIFLEKLDYYRSIAEGIGVDTLIQKLYRETGLMSLASKSGGRENLILLYDYARSYEAGAFKGLYNFIHFINGILNKKSNFDDARAASTDDAVRIITAHSSKGLEYPVVFAVETNSEIYNKERTSRLSYCEDFGFSFLLRTPGGLALADNPVQKMIQSRVTDKLYEEDLRVLYVVLTRARERLYVVGKCPLGDRAKYEARIDSYKENLSEYSFRQLNSFQEIVLCCDGRRAQDQDEFCSVPSLIDTEQILDEPETFEIDIAEPRDEELYGELVRRFSYKYPNQHLTLLPEKMSVSLMSPTILDGSEEVSLPDNLCVLDSADENKSADCPTDERKILPSFVTGSGADESAKRGIATHLFMQFCDIDNLVKDGGRAELDRLIKRGFISPEDGERVRIREIEMFRESDLLRQMRDAKKVHRELRFNVYLEATNFATMEEKVKEYQGEEILVQGVIDCIIERDDGGIVLCDYKTDRLSKEELSDRRLAEERLNEKHSMQLGLYSLAIEKIFGKRPDDVMVYSLPLGDTVKIKI